MSLGRKFHVLILTLLFFQAGCLSRRRTIPESERMLPAQSITRAQLVDLLQKRSDEVKTLNARRVTLDISTGSNKTGDAIMEYRQTTGFIIVERPNHIRIRAQAPLALATVFDMVSDGRQYSASIPFKNKFFVGDATAPPKASNPVLNLRPQHIMDALFVDVGKHLKNSRAGWLVEEATSGRNSYYVFQVLNTGESELSLIEKIWIDRTSMQIARKQMFTRDGKVETDVEYSGYQLLGEIAFPQVIAIRRPIEDYMLKITFVRTALNEQLAADAFHLERPAGAELVQLESAVRPF